MGRPAVRFSKHEPAIVVALLERDLLSLAEECSKAHGVTILEMVGRARQGHIVAARHEFWRRLHVDRGWSPGAIGGFLGCDGSTVRAALVALDAYMTPTAMAGLRKAAG